MSDRANGKNKPLDHSIENPHDHDVLSGRGNFVNYHAGNEYFRALVRQHKVAYVACPKPQKGMFSKLIVDEIRNRVPPGRFLKQDNDTKLWYETEEKKALDKTRQALREGAPELMKDVDPSDDEEEQDSTLYSVPQGYGGPLGFGTSESPNYVSSSGPGSLPMASPNPAPSARIQLYSPPSLLERNRVVPGMINTPAEINQNTSLRESGGMGSLSRPVQSESIDPTAEQLSKVYGAANFEPTPINPNVQIKVAGGAPPRRGIQRDDSLTFDNLFMREKLPIVDKPSKKMDNSSQHLSAMSFSIGDITDASNLSAVFQDSMRIAEDAPSVYPKIDNGRQLPRAFDVTDVEPKKKTSSKFDMSTASSLGSYGLEASMMHMSFRTHDDDGHKD